MHPVFTRKRYEVVRTLGEGATGVVYEAYDREREAHVALKVLRHADAATLQSFKAEFRSLADLRHENVIELFDLVVGDGAPYFTMELVEGCHFLAFVRGAEGDTARTLTLPMEAASARDANRFTRAALQLARGLSTVHAAGILHRDIKPSNVLVDVRGRVVIVDFGLAVRARAEGVERGLLGTPAYMAPELGLGEAATAASDWYAVGTMFFEALTGSAPFEGTGMDVLEQRLLRVAPLARAVWPGVPASLEALCARLLDAAPDARPAGAEVARLLGEGHDHSGAPRAISIPPAAAALVGRDVERAALEAALDETVQRRAACVVVRGASGMGKTALIRSFVDDACRERGALVLEGRCYERESVPYKGIDSVLDALTLSMSKLKAEARRALFPRTGFDVLCRLFPVLASLPGAPSTTAVPPGELADARQLRAQAFAALRELFERLGRAQPTVVVLDDIQWGDADSALLLPELWSVPGILLVFGYRTDAQPSSPQLTALLERRAAARDTRVITLGPLPPAEAERLVRSVLGDGASTERVDRVMVEAGHTPFFLSELAHFARSFDVPLDELRLTGLLSKRLKQLPDGARDLLEVVAVAGQPTALALLRGAAGLGGAQATACLSALQRAHLLRTVWSTAGEQAAPFHDRIRETVVSGLASARAAEIHARLAAALDATGSADPETLFEHHRGAGNTARAIDAALRAGERAEAVFAARRAAHFYARARELLPVGDPRFVGASESLGRALTGSGRGTEAAEAFLVAAEGAGAAAAFDLRRRASEQLLMSGHIDRGIRLAEEVLVHVRLQIAPTWWQAVLSLIWLRMLKSFRGLTFRKRGPSAAQTADVARLDVAYGVSTGLLFAETVRGAQFATRSFLLAMRAGEPSRAARAMAVEGVMIGNEGDMAGAVKHFEGAWEIVERHGVPDERSALIFAAEGNSRLLWGNFRGAAVSYRRAKERFARIRVPNQWEVSVVQFMSSNNRAWLGEWAELGVELPALIKDATDRGDQFLGTMLRVCETNGWWLVRDDPAGAREAVREGLAGWAQASFRTPHAWAEVALAAIELYEGSARASLQRLDDLMGPLRRVFLTRFRYARIRVQSQRGLSAVGSALAAPSDAHALLGVASDSASKLGAERSPLGRALGSMVLGTIAAARGRDVDARVHFHLAARLSDDLGMSMHAAIAQRRAAELEGDEAAVGEADALLRASGVVDVERMSFALAPFLPRR
jgi:predicted Ser/Thr protein kinase